MAGIRYSEPYFDDIDVTINDEDYVKSDYTGSEAKTTVKETTNTQTNKMMESTSTSATPETRTSPATGCIDEVEIGENNKDIEEKLKKSEIEKLAYVAQKNPEYFEEMELTPDDIFAAIGPSGDSGFTYQEDEYISDENGYIYLEDSYSSGYDYSSGLDLSGKPVVIQVSGEFCHPVNGKGSISSNFGLRLFKGGKWALHAGTDWAVAGPCYAIYGGEVSKTYPGNSPISGYGNYVELKFNYKGKNFYCFYAHLSKVFVKKGDKVVKGQKIGITGGTGKVPPYGVHLHFEIKDAKRNNKWTKLQGKLTDNYRGRMSNQVNPNSLILDGNTFATNERFDPYIPPEDFLRNPDNYLKNPNTFV